MVTKAPIEIQSRTCLKRTRGRCQLQLEVTFEGICLKEKSKQTLAKVMCLVRTPTRTFAELPVRTDGTTCKVYKVVPAGGRQAGYSDGIIPYGCQWIDGKGECAR